MPSLDRVDIREAASATKIVETDQSNKQRQGFAGNGNFVPMVLGSNKAFASNASDLDQAIETVAGYVQNIVRDIDFRIDATTHQPVVTVMDQESDRKSVV